jgi:hypothetical protein
MTVGQSLGHCIASAKLFMKDLLFPHDKELEIDLTSVVRHALASLNTDPDAYDVNLAEALDLAEKIGMTVNPSDIPAKVATPRKGFQGPVISGSTVSIGINCDMANVFDVAGAARLADSLASEPNLRLIDPMNAAEPAKMAS